MTGRRRDSGNGNKCMAKKPRKSIWNATAAERDAAVADLEAFDPHKAKPLSKRGRVLWKAATRGRGRPRKPAGEKTRRVVISVEPRLLKRMDAFAKSHGLDRSKLIAKGVENVMATAGGG